MSRCWRFLVPPRQQDHHRVAVLPEIDPIAGTKVDPVFAHAFANRLDIGDVALLQAGDGACDLGTRDRVQFRKPLGKRRSAAGGKVVADFKHGAG